MPLCDTTGHKRDCPCSAETHKDDFFSVPEDNPLKEMLETAGEIVSQDSDTEQAYLAFICKRLKLNFRKLSVEERKWLKRLRKNPTC